MAKFCVYCGKQLEDGAECDCAQSQVAKQAQAQQQQAQAYQQQAQAAQQQAQAQQQQAQAYQQQAQAYQQQAYQQAQQQQAYQQAQQQQAYQQPYVAPAPNPAVQAIGAAFKSLTTIVNKPIESLQAFVKAQNFIAALILIGGQALVAAFFTIALAGSLKIGEIVNLAAVFFETFAFSLVLSAVLFGMIFLLTIIFKGKTDAKTLLCVVAVRSVIVIPFMVLGLLIGLANAGIGIGLFIICEFFAMFYMYAAMRFASNLPESKLMFVIPIAMTIVLIVLVLIMQGLAKSMISDFIGNAFGGMSSMFGSWD